MLEHYVQILTEGLQKKIDLLKQIQEVNQRQTEITEQTQFDPEEFDKTVEEKDVLIQELNRLDVGFEATYSNHKQQLQDHKEEYKAEIATMKEMIGDIMALSASIQASEERNRKQVQRFFREEKERIKQRKVGQKVASDYYKTTNEINYVDPQLLDQKK